MPFPHASDSSSLKEDLNGATKEISSLLKDSKYSIYSSLFTAMSGTFCIFVIAIAFVLIAGKHIQGHGM